MLRALGNRAVYHMAVQLHRAESLGLRVFPGFQHLASVDDLLFAGTESIVDRLDVLRMDDVLAAEAQGPRLLRLGDETIDVIDVRPGCVERLHARGAGADRDDAAGVRQLVRVLGPANAHVEREVLAAQHQAGQPR